MPSATYGVIIEGARDFLKETQSIKSESSRSSREVVRHIRKLIKNGLIQVDATDGTILNYLSKAANSDPLSGIVTGGPHGGYWYDASNEIIPEAKPLDEQEIRSEVGASVIVQEKDLYPLMELWLEKKGYSAKDMSSLRSGGRWGNPDIIGAELVELFGAVQIELASCEVKLNDQDWEHVIFEAISHKRFSNRSWFCYRVPMVGEPLSPGMEYYAERYKVGIVQIILGDSELADLNAKKKIPLDFIDNVVEKIPALYDHVPLKEQRDLVERTGLSLSLSF